MSGDTAHGVLIIAMLAGYRLAPDLTELQHELRREWWLLVGLVPIISVIVAGLEIPSFGFHAVTSVVVPVAYLPLFIWHILVPGADRIGAWLFISVLGCVLASFYAVASLAAISVFMLFYMFFLVGTPPNRSICLIFVGAEIYLWILGLSR